MLLVCPCVTTSLIPLSQSTEVKMAEFRELKASIDRRLYDLGELLGPNEAAAVKDLRAGIEGYFDSLAPILEAGKKGFPGGTAAMRDELTSHRVVASSVAKRIERINEQNFVNRNAEVEKARISQSAYLFRMTSVAFILGFVVTGLSGYRIVVARRRDRLYQLDMKKKESELRQLSAKLVRAQEDERKALSRELHDEVGPDAHSAWNRNREHRKVESQSRVR